MKQSKLWTLDELAAACGGVVHGTPSTSFGGVSIDSRSVTVGDIFVAITGDKMDGHDFVPSAIEKGAGIAIVSKVLPAWASTLPLLVVPDDPLNALERLGSCGAFAQPCESDCRYRQCWKNQQQGNVARCPFC